MDFDFKGKKGFLLPMSGILALIIVTTLAMWYKQSVLQSFLANRLLDQRKSYLECKSLLPFLVGKLDELDSEKLGVEDKNFFQVENRSRSRWSISRSIWVDNKVRFTFNPAGKNGGAITLTVKYVRE